MLSFDNVQNKHQHIKFISSNGSRRHSIRSRQHFILQQKIIRSRHKHIIFYAHAGAMQHLPDEVFLLSKNLSEKSFKKNILTTFLQIKYQYVLEINYQ